MASNIEKFKRGTLVSLVLRTLGIVEGRTRLQKIVYLADVAGWNTVTDYRYHYYGPYSDAVTAEIESFQKNDWLYEESKTTTNGRDFYIYSLTTQGKKISDALAARMEDPKMIKKIMNFIKGLNIFSSEDLEIMATLVFLKRNVPKLTDDKLVSVVRDLKPKFDVAQIKKNLRIFSILANFSGSRLEKN